jgi:alpha-galactosidase
MTHAVTWSIDAVGAVTVASGPFRISGMFPACDGVPLRPCSVSTDTDRVNWLLPDGGVVRLSVRPDNDALIVQLSLLGFPQAPGRIALCTRSQVVGGVRAWCLAEGMAGGSTCMELPAQKAQRSAGCSALIAKDGSALGIWAEDQQRFIHHALWEGSRLDLSWGTEGIPLANGTLDLPALRFAWAADPWSIITRMLDACARAAHVVIRPRERTWCSWYYFYHHFSRADLDAVLAGLVAQPDRGGVSVVQIDAGYCTSIGDWLEPNHLWPGGLRPAFAAIAAAGYTPGVWIGPFMVGNRSRLWREHPEWLLRDLDGSPVTPIRNYGEIRLWHYPDEEYGVLDTSHPEAFAYLRTVFTTLVAWGARLFKTDFLYWAMQDSSQVRRATPGRTSTELLRDVMRMIREVLGSDRYLLGCIAPYAPCLGLVDGMRIAGDVGPQWSGGFNPQSMLNETRHAMALDGRWFHSDPDALLVRDFHTGFLDHEVEALALWQAMTGGNICTSDPLHRCAPERQQLWRLCDSSRAPFPAFAPGYGLAPTEKEISTAVRDLGDGRWVLLALNASEQPHAVSIPVSAVAGLGSAWIRAWRPQAETKATNSDHVSATLPAHAARLWLISQAAEVGLPSTLSG